MRFDRCLFLSLLVPDLIPIQAIDARLSGGCDLTYVLTSTTRESRSRRSAGRPWEFAR
jgi:hypothetical protein